MENTYKTCINNDDGLCDRKGILVEDEDSCEHHWAAADRSFMPKPENALENMARSSLTRCVIWCLE